MKRRLKAAILALVVIFSFGATVYAYPGAGTGSPPVLPTSIELPCPETDPFYNEDK